MESAPPPPAVCDPVSFIVYFEFDRSNLTPEAVSRIDRAVEDAKSCNYNVVNVEGHADKSGNPRYNIGLSQRRAGIVRDQMVSRGVDASLISLDAFGEARPAVDTPDGRKEPLNRRTEVRITFR